MKKILCSVFDSKAGIFASPFTSMNRGVATRDFRQACLDPQSSLNKFPADYSLYELAEFDDDSGHIEPAVSPTHLINAASFFEE